jgi:hypothetical protein
MEANRPRSADDGEQLQAMHDDLASVLRQLDDLELHHAAAHVAMAIDSLRRDLPLPAPSP